VDRVPHRAEFARLKRAFSQPASIVVASSRRRVVASSRERARVRA
jgi:hypothetical protein